jgi:hypothetical protein
MNVTRRVVLRDDGQFVRSIRHRNHSSRPASTAGRWKHVYIAIFFADSVPGVSDIHTLRMTRSNISNHMTGVDGRARASLSGYTSPRCCARRMRTMCSVMPTHVRVHIEEASACRVWAAIG